MFPSADVIAVAIYAAARELAPPVLLRNEVALKAARGVKDVGERKGYGGGYPFARTRAYAAVALWEAFPEASKSAIGHRVGQGHAGVWAANFERNLKTGALPWWDTEVARRVSAAVAWAIKRTA